MNRILPIGCLLCAFIVAPAQSFEEQYRAFQQAALQEYMDFRAAANENYARFLQAAWKYYRIMLAATGWNLKKMMKNLAKKSKKVLFALLQILFAGLEYKLQAVRVSSY